MTSTAAPSGAFLTPAEQSALSELQNALTECTAADYERLSARLISKLLDVPVFVSKAGYQFGADAGTAGLRGRHLRIECKRYQETTSTNARSLKGQIVEAVQGDESLEVWVLVSTKTISEGDRKDLIETGMLLGLPVVVIDWTVTSGTLPLAAALCVSYVDSISSLLGPKGEVAARLLALRGEAGCDALRKDLQPWAIGFKRVRELSLAKMADVWTKKNESLAQLGQDASGGISEALVHREDINRQLDYWWRTSLVRGPAAIHGREGHGKTWATLDWLDSRSDELPIVILLAATSFAKSGHLDEESLLDILATSMRGFCKGSLDAAHWRRRAERLLSRPPEESPAMLLVVDGLNQHPNYDWARLVWTVQSERFRKRIRLAVSVRTHFLQHLRDFGVAADAIVKVEIGPYSDSPGGELEQAARAHGIDVRQLPASLLAVAAVPRILPLVAKLKDRDALRADASLHRILWEYGRDDLFLRASATLKSGEFESWISDRANEWRNSVAAGARALRISSKNLSVSVSSPATSPDDVARRLSELVDGLWVASNDGGRHFTLTRNTLVLGLAVAVLDVLRSVDSDIDGLLAELELWLEPIAAFDETTEVVQAALSILSASARNTSDVAGDRPMISALFTAWLYAQNPAAAFEKNAQALGQEHPISLMDAMERTRGQGQAYRLNVSAEVLRKFPLSQASIWKEIDSRLTQWCALLLLSPHTEAGNTAAPATSNDARVQELIGSITPGERCALGVPVKLSRTGDSTVATIASRVLEGHSIERLKRPFIAAAIARTVRAANLAFAWDGLSALALFAPGHDSALRAALRDWAGEIQSMVLEEGIASQLRACVAALLLRASAERKDEAAARQLEIPHVRHQDYEHDYESKPVDSHIALERRHAELMLEAGGKSVITAFKRAARFIADPSVAGSHRLRTRLEDYATQLNPADFDTGMERQYEALEPAYARFAPATLLALVNRRLSALPAESGLSKYWAAVSLRQFLLLAGPDHSRRLGEFRRESRIGMVAEEQVANCLLLQLELLHLPPNEQLEAVAATDAIITKDLLSVIRPGAVTAVLKVLATPSSSVHACSTVLQYVATTCDPLPGGPMGPEETEALIALLARHLGHEQREVRVAALLALYNVSSLRLCSELLALNWSANVGDVVGSYYGSLAVAQHGRHVAFDDLCAVLAPQCLIQAAHLRGNEDDELEAAISRVTDILRSAPIDPAALHVPARIEVMHGEFGRAHLRYSEQTIELSPEQMLDSHDESAAAVNDRINGFNASTSARVEDIRRCAAPLFLQEIDHVSLGFAWAHSAGRIRSWLDGMSEEQGGARRAFNARLHSADGLFFALCRVLLEQEPETGAALWQVIRAELPFRHVGRAGIPSLVHLLFEVPRSGAVDQLREELLFPAAATSDLSLLEIVIAAQMNNAESWLRDMVAKDEASELQWRRRRSIVIRGFASTPRIDSLDWPSGQVHNTWEQLENWMKLWATRGTLARHWWIEFLQATGAEQAYTALAIFLSCVDRRAHLWMWDELRTRLGDAPLDRIKRLHCTLNRDVIQRRMATQENRAPSKLSNQLLGGPRPHEWLSLDRLSYDGPLGDLERPIVGAH